MYKVSIGVTTNMKVSATSWIAQNADELGVDSIWVGEDIGLGQDAFVLTSACLLQSKKVRVGTGIIPFATNDVISMARATATLQQTSDNRFVFGTGVGGIQDLQRLGIKIRKPVTELRTTIDVLKQLWAGNAVTVQSELMDLEDQTLNLKKPVEIPIFLGIRGLQMQKLAGEIADGIILSGPIDYLRKAVKTIDNAARKVGRNAEDVEKVAWLPTIPTFKGGSKELAKKVVAIVVADMPQPVIEILDIDEEKIGRLREAVAKGGPSAGIPYVDQEIVDMFSISGDKDHMVEQFEKLSDIGITECVIGPPFSGKWREAITELITEINAYRPAERITK
ncbi:MAG: LLM class flavin-dependent oxidoreductase [Candidatus Thorarchaeota archaeon]